MLPSQEQHHFATRWCFVLFPQCCVETSVSSLPLVCTIFFSSMWSAILSWFVSAPPAPGLPPPPPLKDLGPWSMPTWLSMIHTGEVPAEAATHMPWFEAFVWNSLRVRAGDVDGSPRDVARSTRESPPGPSSTLLRTRRYILQGGRAAAVEGGLLSHLSVAIDAANLLPREKRKMLLEVASRLLLAAVLGSDDGETGATSTTVLADQLGACLTGAVCRALPGNIESCRTAIRLAAQPPPGAFASAVGLLSLSWWGASTSALPDKAALGSAASLPDPFSEVPDVTAFAIAVAQRGAAQQPVQWKDHTCAWTVGSYHDPAERLARSFMRLLCGTRSVFCIRRDSAVARLADSGLHPDIIARIAGELHSLLQEQMDAPAAGDRTGGRRSSPPADSATAFFTEMLPLLSPPRGATSDAVTGDGSKDGRLQQLFRVAVTSQGLPMELAFAFSPPPFWENVTSTLPPSSIGRPSSLPLPAWCRDSVEDACVAFSLLSTAVLHRDESHTGGGCTRAVASAASRSATLCLAVIDAADSVACGDGSAVSALPSELFVALEAVIRQPSLQAAAQAASDGPQRFESPDLELWLSSVNFVASRMRQRGAFAVATPLCLAHWCENIANALGWLERHLAGMLDATEARTEADGVFLAGGASVPSVGDARSARRLAWSRSLPHHDLALALLRLQLQHAITGWTTPCCAALANCGGGDLGHVEHRLALAVADLIRRSLHDEAGSGLWGPRPLPVPTVPSSTDTGSWAAEALSVIVSLLSNEVHPVDPVIFAAALDVVSTGHSLAIRRKLVDAAALLASLRGDTAAALSTASVLVADSMWGSFVASRLGASCCIPDASVRRAMSLDVSEALKTVWLRALPESHAACASLLLRAGGLLQRSAWVDPVVWLPLLPSALEAMRSVADTSAMGRREQCAALSALLDTDMILDEDTDLCTRVMRRVLLRLAEWCRFPCEVDKTDESVSHRRWCWWPCEASSVAATMGSRSHPPGTTVAADEAASMMCADETIAALGRFVQAFGQGQDAVVRPSHHAMVLWKLAAAMAEIGGRLGGRFADVPSLSPPSLATPPPGAAVSERHSHACATARIRSRLRPPAATSATREPLERRSVSLEERCYLVAADAVAAMRRLQPRPTTPVPPLSVLVAFARAHEAHRGWIRDGPAVQAVELVFASLCGQARQGQEWTFSDHTVLHRVDVSLLASLGQGNTCKHDVLALIESLGRERDTHVSGQGLRSTRHAIRLPASVLEDVTVWCALAPLATSHTDGADAISSHTPPSTDVAASLPQMDSVAVRRVLRELCRCAQIAFLN